jgi:hypothetical protein
MCHFVNRVLEKLSTFLVLRSAFISRQVKDDAIWRRLSLGVAYQRGEICRSRLLWSAITKPSHPHENVSSAHADALQRRYNGSHDPFPIDISPEHQARQSSTSEQSHPYLDLAGKRQLYRIIVRPHVSRVTTLASYCLMR